MKEIRGDLIHRNIIDEIVSLLQQVLDEFKPRNIYLEYYI